jgi:type IV pilus assembly protein PilA
VEEPRKDGFEKEESHVMVVVLIIAILIAIAIPTFLGARTRAQDRAAQTSLERAGGGEVHLHRQAGLRPGDQDRLGRSAGGRRADPELRGHRDRVHGAERDLDRHSGTGTWYGAVRSDASATTCFYIKDDVSSGTTYATGTTCTATAAAPAARR